MVYGLWLSTAGVMAGQVRQDVAANNLANANTVGFKHDLAVLRERQVASRESAVGGLRHELYDHLSGGTAAGPTVTVREQGALAMTGRALDVAIEGPGYFSVSDRGQVRYTRDGRFTVAADGRLVTVAGHRAVLDVSGRPIVVRAGGGAVRVESDGRVLQGDTVIGRLAVVDFADASRVRKVGGNLFDAGGQAGRPAAGRLRSGAVEQSTVNSVRAMMEMMEAARSVEANARLIELQAQTLEQVVRELGRVSV